MEEKEETKPKRYYKIEVGDIITINRNSVRGFVFYKTPIWKKHSDGTEKYLYKQISFDPNVELEDNTKILVKDFYEDMYMKKNDKYTTIWTVHITDFDIVSDNLFDNYNESKRNFILDDLNDRPF